jgi:hypothetical protein
VKQTTQLTDGNQANSTNRTKKCRAHSISDERPLSVIKNN